MAFFHLPGAKNRVSARRAYTAARKTASREELLEGLRRYNENAVMKGEIIPAGTREITKVNVGEVAAYIAREVMNFEDEVHHARHLPLLWKPIEGWPTVRLTEEEQEQLRPGAHCIERGNPHEFEFR